MVHKLQYISQGNTAEEQLFNIQKVLENGCQWVQLRFKNGTDLEVAHLAEKTKRLCQEYKATFIINDKVDLAYQMDADGVHLGLDDMRIADARAILGDHKIIGGTANTFLDIQNHNQNGCNYVGLGPFKFTTTKAKLSPVLGLEGYDLIIEKMKNCQLEIPVVAIGGIQLEDVEKLLETGIHGIAVSSLLTQKPKLITEINEKLYAKTIV